MRFLPLGAAALAAASISTAAMAASPQVEAPIRQFIDAFNKGDIKGAAATHLASVSIIDEVAPHIWQGPNGFMAWAGDLMADAKARGQTGNTVKLGAVKREVISGETAYVIMAATYSYAQKGVAMREPAQMTYALKKTAEGWKIAGWSWTGPNPTPAK
ncbi:MAG: nuclear transport factor 2 family protein [Caulobacteraceae bacterium]